jgi:hypothetical protein
LHATIFLFSENASQSEMFGVVSKAGITSSNHGKTKLFETPPVTSGAGKCEELDEDAYIDRKRRDARETPPVMTGAVWLPYVWSSQNCNLVQ